MHLILIVCEELVAERTRTLSLVDYFRYTQLIPILEVDSVDLDYQRED